MGYKLVAKLGRNEIRTRRTFRTKASAEKFREIAIRRAAVLRAGARTTRGRRAAGLVLAVRRRSRVEKVS